MDGGAWWAAVHGVTTSRTWLSDFTFIFHFHALEEEMATHSSILAWRIPGMAEPGGLPSMGSHRVGHDWSDLAAAAANQTKSTTIFSVPVELLFLNWALVRGYQLFGGMVKTESWETPSGWYIILGIHCNFFVRNIGRKYSEICMSLIQVCMYCMNTKSSNQFPLY